MKYKQLSTVELKEDTPILVANKNIGKLATVLTIRGADVFVAVDARPYKRYAWITHSNIKEVISL